LHSNGDAVEPFSITSNKQHAPGFGRGLNQTTMPNIQSTSMPERAARDFNEWHEDLQFEKDLERLLDEFKASLLYKVRTHLNKR
jgi:hypothetical protein